MSDLVITLLSSILAMKCGANMEYAALVSACPRTCAAPNAHEECHLPKVEGCRCKAGFILSGTECVPESQCGCVDADDNYRKVNH